MKRIDTPALAVYASEELTIEAINMMSRHEIYQNNDVYFFVHIEHIDDPNMWQSYKVYADGNVELAGQSKNWK